MIIIMDFAEAFDKVSHRHLLYKLNYYGVNDKALHWIGDFLDHRSQTVVLEGETSRAATIQLPHDTIRITIFASRYDTYRDTFFTTIEP